MPKTCHQMSDARRGKEGLSPRSIRESMALPTPWFQSCSLLNCEIIHLYCFKLPSLACFATAVLGSRYIWWYKITASPFELCIRPWAKLFLQVFTSSPHSPRDWEQHVYFISDPTELFCFLGIFQARILEWVALPFSRGFSQTRDQNQVSCFSGRFFNSWATREAQLIKGRA